MRAFRRPAQSLRPMVALAAVLLCTTSALAGASTSGDRPLDPVSFAGRVLDAQGSPLSGTHGLTLRYVDLAGAELFREDFAAVPIVDGTFTIELGTGLAGASDYASLASVFADHPELRLEVAIDGVPQEPALGILPAGHSLKSRLVAAGLRPENDDQPHWKGYQAQNGATAIQSGVLAPAGSRGQAAEDDGTVRRRPYTLPVIGPSLSPAVRDLPRAVLQDPRPDTKEINPPRHESLYDENGNRFGTIAPKQDDYLADNVGPGTRTPGITLQFEGVNNVSGVLPPDTEGTVGPNHYVQVVNLAFAIYSKSGTLLTGPSNTNTLWAGFGGPCQTDNSGDAIFVYDQQADRFVLTQFAVSGSHQSVCFAVSTSPDPTGTYYRYEVVTPRFPDYYKVGVWPDATNNAYFFGTNSGYQSQYDVFAVDRARMLTGSSARPMQFFQNFVNLMMPADVDGPAAPPSGSPGIFYTFRDGGEPYFGSPPADSIDVWEYHVDWNTPSNSTFTLVNSLAPAPFNWTVCGFFVSNCIPQPGTSQGIDSASWWPMQRLVYRNFGSYEALVGAWTVDVNAVGNRAAPRWFELRDSGGGWSIYQQGTHSPDSIHRWMPSVAMDASGNIALGYSRGNGSNYPSIYYSVHGTGDALGTMQTEALMYAGTGSQTHSAARWGDYASMELDPADDCTFWFTTEYLATTSSASWRTRVGAFTVPGCGGPPVPDFSVSCVPSSQSIQQGGNGAATCTVTSTGGFSASVALSCAGAPAGISCAFAPPSVTPPADGSADSALTLSVDAGQATGSFGFDVEAVNGGTTKTAPLSVNVTAAGSNGPQVAVYDSGLGAPKCAIAGSSCDSTTLLNSRDNLSPSEPNQPNTITACADGSSGSYHSDESNDRIVVSTLDSGNFTEGDTVEIAATVYAWSTGTSDHLDLYYAADANNPSWVWITTINNPGSGVQTLTAQYTLPAGGLQAVRANFRYNGSTSSCSTGAYDDHDDLVFAVESAVQCTVDADCDDGAFCNGEETCNAGQCEAGTPVACDDGAFCNGSETCNEASDQCDPGSPPCDPGSETCNEGTDSCDAGTPPACDDGQFCNGTETCNEGTDSCDAGTPPACDDGQFCNGTETCNEGTDSCDAGTPPACDDGQFCNGTETCNEATDSCDAGTPPACDDGAFCNGTETCNEGTDSCDAGTPPCGPGQTCDEGTDICVGGPSPKVWMSFKTNTSVPGVGTVADEDIVSYDQGSGLWKLEFDGSDVGLGSYEIDGLAVLPGGDLLLSFTAPGTIGGMSVDDSDIVRFTPTSMGSTTAGTFSFYFDGSDVGLTTNGEDVDSVGLAPDGRLLISTTGGMSANGASGADEDLFIFTGTVGSSNTSGSFALYFDGSDVGLNNSSSEDVDAAGMTASGHLLFSTLGNFSVTGVSGLSEDIVEFAGTFGSSTSGTFSMRLDLSTLGISTTENVGSLHVVE